jgi:hypothetical protein
MFDLFAIGCLQRPEDSDITGLELKRGVGGHTARDDAIFKQNSKISIVSSVPKPSQIGMRGFMLASCLVWGLNTS